MVLKDLAIFYRYRYIIFPWQRKVFVLHKYLYMQCIKVICNGYFVENVEVNGISWSVIQDHQVAVQPEKLSAGSHHPWRGFRRIVREVWLCGWILESSQRCQVSKLHYSSALKHFELSFIMSIISLLDLVNNA